MPMSSRRLFLSLLLLPLPNLVAHADPSPISRAFQMCIRDRDKARQFTPGARRGSTRAYRAGVQVRPDMAVGIGEELAIDLSLIHILLGTPEAPAQLERLVSRVSLEKGVSSVRWQVFELAAD